MRCSCRMGNLLVSMFFLPVVDPPDKAWRGTLWEASVANFTPVGKSKRWRCDYKYVQETNGYFKFHEIPATWQDARLRCQLEGGILASPHPAANHNALVALLNETLFGSVRKSYDVFIGIHSTYSKGDFQTINGIPLSEIPHKWQNLEPNNLNNNEDCLVLSPEGLMADANCEDTYPYVCYRAEKQTDFMSLSSCGTSDHAYQFSEATGSCYKFHPLQSTWARSNMICKAEGGHLAIINSNAEARVLKDLFSRYPLDRKSCKDVVFIGFTDWGEHDDWRTIHGQTLIETGYDTFAHGQPDNAHPGEHCGAMFRSGTLDDFWCDRNCSFICEKNPASLTVCPSQP